MKIKDLRCIKVYLADRGKELIEVLRRQGFEINITKAYEYPYLMIREDGKVDFRFMNSDFYSCEYPEYTVDAILEMDSPDINQEEFTGFAVSARGEIFKRYKWNPRDYDWFKQFHNKKEAEAWKYLPELLYWRNKYNDNLSENEIDPEKITYLYHKYNIMYFKDEHTMYIFLNKFKDLIKKCLPLL